MILRSTTAVALAAVAVLAAGCGSDDGPESGTGSEGRAPVLNLGMIDAPGAGGFVAANMSFASKAPYGQAVYDTLVTATPTNEIQANLATEWSYDDSNTVLTMTLRDDVEFTDGTAFTAEIAAENVLRFRDGTAENAVWLASVKNAKAVDETTLEITLKAPDPALLLNLSKAAGYQESPDSFEDPSPIGSGPYVLDEDRTVTDATYVFTVNEDYWNPDAQHYDEIVMNVYEDPVAAQNALLGGQLDAALYSGYDGFEQIEGAGFTANEQSLDWEGLLLFDRSGAINPAFADVRVRQAINYAIDREGLLEALAGGRGEVTTQVFGPNTDGYLDELEGEYAHDPEQARSLLEEAGFGDGLEVTIPTVSFVPPATFDLLGQQLEEVGITATFDERAPQDYVGDLLGGAYALASFRLEQPTTAWETFNLVASVGAPWNATHIPDETVEELGATIQTGTPEEAAAAAEDLNTYLVEEAWFNPWYRTVTTFYTDEETTVDLQQGNVFPYLWNIAPAE